MTEEPPTFEAMSVSQYIDLKAQLTRIEGMLNQPEVKPILVGLDGLKIMLGCKSLSAAQRRAEEFGIKALAFGKYRIKDVENAIARRVISKQERFTVPDAKWEGKK